MADPTIPPPPQGFTLDTPQSPAVIYGAPKLPSPQTPDQATGQALQNTRTQQEIRQAEATADATTQKTKAEAESAQIAAQTAKEAYASAHPQGTGSTIVGPASLQGLSLPDQELVKALADGRLAFPGGFALKAPWWQQKLEQVAQYDPTFDATNFNNRAKSRATIVNGKLGASANALNTAIGHLGTLETQIGGTASHDFTPLNAVENFASQTFGDPGITNFKDTAQKLADELESVYRNGGGAEQGVVRQLSSLDPNASEAQKQGIIRNALDLLASKQAANLYQYNLGSGGKPEIDLLDPAARSVLDRFPDIRDKYFAQSAGPMSRGAAELLMTHGGVIPPSPPGGTGSAPNGAGPPGLGGTPNNPTDQTVQNVGGFNDELTFNPAGATQFHDALFKAAKAGLVRSLADAQAWSANYNKQNGTDYGVSDTPSTRQALAAAAAGKPFGVDIPQMTQTEAARMNQRIAASGGKADAATLGAADSITVGAFKPLIAAGDAAGDFLSGNGFDYTGNLNADTNYVDANRAAHPGYFIGGQLAGGLALPVGEVESAADLAKVGAAYGGAYGFNSSAGQPLGQRAVNLLLGAGAGAAVPFALSGVGSAVRGVGATAARTLGLRGPEALTVPPLVDPQTGELNQPINALSPAQRVQAFADQGITNPGMAAVGGRTARVLDQGFRNLPPSAGLMEDAASQTAKEARAAMDSKAALYGDASSLNEAGTSLQTGVNQWMARAEGTKGTTDKGIVGKLYDAIPINGSAAATLDNTRSTLQNLTNAFPSNPDLRAAFANPKLGKFLDALTPSSQDVSTGLLDASGQPIVKSVSKGGSLSWNDLKNFRSEIGDMIGDRQFIDTGGTTGNQLRALYGSLSADMEATASAQGPKALAAFNRANDIYSAVQARKEQALATVLGPDALKNPEAAAAAVQRMSRSSGGDLSTLAQVRSSMTKSGLWGDVASTLIRMGGLPAQGEGRAFNPQTFLNWYSGMTEPARALIFGGTNDSLRQSLDGFVAATQQLAKVKGLSNTSNTTPTFLGAAAIRGVAGGAAGIAAFFHPLAALGTAAGVGAGAAAEYQLAKAWTSPEFVRLATGYARAIASNNPNAVSSQVGRLTKLATTNPELRAGVDSLIRSAANSNAPATGRIAASPDQGPQQQTNRQ